MVLDAHVHVFWREAVVRRQRLLRLDQYFGELYRSPRARMATTEELLDSMDAAGVDMAVLAGFGWADAGLCREHNAYILDSVRRNPGRLLGLAIANPRDTREAERELAQRLDAGLSGIGELMPDSAGYSWSQPQVTDCLAALARAYEMPLLLHVSEPVGHLYPGKGSVAPAQVVSFAEHYPEVTLVCAHWGGGLPFYELMPEVQAALRRVYYDTAAWPLLYDDRIFQVAARLVPEKVLFATDYPLVRQDKALERLRCAGLMPGLEQAYLGQNALQVYRRRME